MDKIGCLVTVMGVHKAIYIRLLVRYGYGGDGGRWLSARRVSRSMKR